MVADSLIARTAIFVFAYYASMHLLSKRLAVVGRPGAAARDNERHGRVHLDEEYNEQNRVHWPEEYDPRPQALPQRIEVWALLSLFFGVSGAQKHAYSPPLTLVLVSYVVESWLSDEPYLLMLSSPRTFLTVTPALDLLFTVYNVHQRNHRTPEAVRRIRASRLSSAVVPLLYPCIFSDAFQGVLLKLLLCAYVLHSLVWMYLVLQEYPGRIARIFAGGFYWTWRIRWLGYVFQSSLHVHRDVDDTRTEHWYSDPE
ncbi:hypothetical protein AURDEDRAFT_171595 [Auricularia subglabra TFB-10046 SS5]|nr:hypothetical protein AURDEDRAFT_171595 [Auricularia subglabra TFB-10046 SS5]